MYACLFVEHRLIFCVEPNSPIPGLKEFNQYSKASVEDLCALHPSFSVINNLFLFHPRPRAETQCGRSSLKPLVQLLDAKRAHTEADTGEEHGSDSFRDVQLLKATRHTHTHTKGSVVVVVNENSSGC